MQAELGSDHHPPMPAEALLAFFLSTPRCGTSAVGARERARPAVSRGADVRSRNGRAHVCRESTRQTCARPFLDRTSAPRLTAGRARSLAPTADVPQRGVDKKKASRASAGIGG